MNRAEVKSAIVSASYNEETDVVVFVTESGDVYFCDGNGFANKKNIKLKCVSMSGLRVKCREGDEGVVCAW